MCGIAGHVGDQEFDGTPMLRAIAHRGPDDDGALSRWYAQQHVWLGNRRLAIVDPSAQGHQPMVSASGRHIIVYNGEVYNAPELRRWLRATGSRLRSGTDTEVVVEAWEREGPAALARFRGMFAFAIWDAREHTLWIARDRMGEKPLYYAETASGIVFGSEVRSILCSGLVERRVDPEGLDSYLTFGSVAHPFSLIRGIRSLGPGHYAKYQDGWLSTHKYWAIEDVPEEPLDIPLEDAMEVVQATLRDACEQCTVADVPIGVLLSGGIDSSANVALLAERGVRPLRTFSVVVGGGNDDLDEDRWSTLVAEKFKTEHHRLDAATLEVRKWAVAAVEAMDQPSHDGINTYIISRAIRQSGLNVALSGQGADELFLGYGQRKHFAKWSAIARSPAAAILRRLEPAAGRSDRWDDSSLEKVLQLGRLSSHAASAAYLTQHSVFSQRGLERLRGETRPDQTDYVSAGGGTTPLGMLSRLELVNYLRNVLLRDGDQMSMANSLEMRQPFLDHVLIETVLRLPATLKVKRGQQKPLLTAAVGDALPRDIINRRKQGFWLPIDEWMRTDLAIEVDAICAATGLTEVAVRQVEERFQAGQSWTRLWTLRVLALWLQRWGVSV